MGHGHGHGHGHGPGLTKPLSWAGVVIFGFIGAAWWMTASGSAARASGKHRSKVTLRSTTTAALKLPTYSDRGSHGGNHAPRAKLTGGALDRFNFVATYHRRMRPRYGLSATAAGPRRDIFRVVFAKAPTRSVLDLVTSGSLQLRREAGTRGFKHYQVLVGQKVVWQKKL